MTVGCIQIADLIELIEGSRPSMDHQDGFSRLTSGQFGRGSYEVNINPLNIRLVVGVLVQLLLLLTPTTRSRRQ